MTIETWKSLTPGTLIKYIGSNDFEYGSILEIIDSYTEQSETFHRVKLISGKFDAVNEWYLTQVGLSVYSRYVLYTIPDQVCV